MTTETKTLLDSATLQHQTLSVIVRIYSLADGSFEITEEWSNEASAGEQRTEVGARGAGPEYFLKSWEERLQYIRQYLDSLEDAPRLRCASCDQEIWTDRQGLTDKSVGHLERGSFSIPDADGECADRSEENIKFDRYICSNCWLTDPDLCAFFNRIGCRIR
jgi:hypothetical protein